MRLRVLAVLVIFSTVVVVGLAAPLAVLVGQERAQRFGESRDAAATFFANLSSREGDSGLPRLREAVERYHDLYDEGAAVVDRTGAVRASSGLDVSSPEIQEAITGALRNQRGDVPSSLTPWSRSSVLIAAPVGVGAQVDGAVVIDASTDSARRDVARAWLVIALGAVLVLVAVTAIAAALSRWVIRPLTQLSTRVHSFGDKFVEQFPPQLDLPRDRTESRAGNYLGPPEVRELTEAFDAMADDVEAATAAQRRLVADTAHALRNPLAAVRMRLDLLGMKIPESAADVHRKTTLEVDRLDSIVADLLALAAAEAPVRRDDPSVECDVAAVIDDRVEFWSSTMTSAGMDIHVVVDEARQAALREDDLARILDALLNNAAKYAGTGARVEIGCRSTNSRTSIWVADTGPGVPETELPMLFRRFYRSSDAHGSGTGLGLAIVHALVERAGGTSTVSANEPSGLRIDLEIPVGDVLS